MTDRIGALFDFRLPGRDARARLLRVNVVALASLALVTPAVAQVQQARPPAVSPQPQPVPPANGAIATGPGSIADLASGLLDAVVNVSTSQNAQPRTAGPQPKIQDGAPFQELFEDFFESPDSGQNAQKASSLGSGFVIDPAGYVVTNNHVIEGADNIEVIFPNGEKLKARLVGSDTKTDLSVLKVEPKSPLPSVRFGDSRAMRIGDWVMAIGNPFGLGGSVTLGIISARGRNINAGPYDNFIQTDAAINRGNSGGPLFNMEGSVIGINTAIFSPSGGSVGIGFAVPTELAENIIRQLIEFGEVRRGWLGVRIQPVSEDMAASLGLDRARGALVGDVIEGGPVSKGELRPGDVILSFDGRQVGEMRDLSRIVAESPLGRPLDVLVLRDGREETVKVTLAELEETPPPAAPQGNVIPRNGGSDLSQDPSGEGSDEEIAPEGEGGESPEGELPGEDEAAGDIAGLDAFGIELAALDEAHRKQFSIDASVEGVVVTLVKPQSPAAAKGLKAGDVIVEVAQDFVETPQDVASRFEMLKAEGRRNAHVMVADAAGNLRFVALPLE